MKKFAIYCFILISITFFVQGEIPSITVDSPIWTDTWYIGKKHIIKWTESYGLTTPVKIRLFSADGKTKILNITNQTDISKDFEWKIPGSVTPDCYVIRVRTIDNKYNYDTKAFTIKKGILLKPGYLKQTLKVFKPDLKVENIFKTKNCDIWVTVRNVGIVKIDRVMREYLWINNQQVSDQQTHFVLTPGSVFSHQILGYKAKFNGTKVKIFIDSDIPLNEITKSNNTLEKTLKCILVLRKKI